jgi:response regulator RpfG family c-di-GMP phosphodiesterase
MQKGRILIVDDDPLVRDVLSAILFHSGNYATELAADGIAGIEKVKASDYDVVFTDLIMPGINGIDFMRAAVKLRPALPVVVITGNSTIDAAINAMREGAKDFITKPFNVSTVTSIADRIIGERRLLNRIDTGDNRDSFIGRLNGELFKRLQEISILQSISTELDALYNNKDIYEKIVEMITRLLMVKEVSFGIIENGTLKIRKAVGVVEHDIPVAGTLFEKVVTTGRHYLASFGEINPHTGVQLTVPFFAIPFTINDETFGIISLSNKMDGSAFTDDEISIALTFAKKAAQRIENNALYEVFYSNLISTLKSLVISIEARDSYTKDHSERVTAYALKIAAAMKLPAEERDCLPFGGYLHDVGKIGVRDTILMKPDRLTPEERAEINLHPVIGGNIIKPLRFFPKERELILHHHENFDGTGYPSGLAGTDIPITARILAVADAYDAMTSSRPYRTARTHEVAVAELLRCSNTQFDGEIVRAFIQAMT